MEPGGRGRSPGRARGSRGQRHPPTRAVPPEGSGAGTASPLRQGLAARDVVAFMILEASGSLHLISRELLLRRCPVVPPVEPCRDARAAVSLARGRSPGGTRGGPKNTREGMPGNVPRSGRDAERRRLGTVLGRASGGVWGCRRQAAGMRGALRSFRAGGGPSTVQPFSPILPLGISAPCRSLAHGLVASTARWPQSPAGSRRGWAAGGGAGAGTSAPPRFIIEFNLQSSYMPQCP